MQKTLLIPLTFCVLLAFSEGRGAEPLVQEALESLGYEQFEPNQIREIIEKGNWVASERFKRSNSLLLQRERYIQPNRENLTGNEYEQVVRIDVDGKPVYMAIPVSSEHLERLRTRQVHVQMIDALEAYAEGLLLIGAVIDEEMLNSFFGEHTDTPEQFGVAHSSDALNDEDGFCHLLEADNEEEIDSEELRVGMIENKFSAYVFLLGPSCMLEAMAARLNQNLEPDFELAARTENRDRSNSATEMVFEDLYEIDGRRVAAYSWTDTAVAAAASGSRPRFQQVGEDGMVTTLRKITVHVDLEHLVRRKIRIEGIMSKEGETRDFFVENEYDDFRYVDNTVLYEPYKETQRMGGILGPEERAQMQEAKQKLDEFERQMAAMPASQRRMMENMMGSQMDQFRQLANDGTVEIVVVTKEIIINPDLGIGSGGGIVPAAQPDLLPNNLVQIIQGHLVTLGYSPGNTNGELTRQTVVAITQYEAASGMTVTGQATPQLAGRLAAAVDAL